MTAKSIKSGREVCFDQILKRWNYTDTSTPTGQSICKNCGKMVDSRYPDPCLGKLPGVEYACCGHGDRERSYIKFTNGVIVRGFISENDFYNRSIKFYKKPLLIRKIINYLLKFSVI